MFKNSNESNKVKLKTSTTNTMLSMFCKENNPDFCMKSKLSEKENQDNLNHIAALMVDRKDPEAGQDSPLLMLSVEVHSIINAGSEVNLQTMIGINKTNFQSQCSETFVYADNEKEIILNAKWLNKSQEKARAGNNANAFGDLGVLLFSPDTVQINIPALNPLHVSQAFLDVYGVALIPLENSFNVEPAEHESLKKLYLVQYNYAKDYIEKFVMKTTGGGGVFVETHPFPQIFIPMSPNCSGAIIVGRKQLDETYLFTSFNIPFGYALKIRPNVIHGDSNFVGPYTTMLSQTELADTVLIRKETPGRDIVRIAFTAIAPAGLRILQSRGLAHELDTDHLRELRNKVLSELKNKVVDKTRMDKPCYHQDDQSNDSSLQQHIVPRFM